MRPDFRVLCAEARSNGITTATVSNGLLIPGQRDLLDHLDELVISLDSTKPEINDRLRGPGACVLAIQAIDLARGRGIRVYVNMVLTRTNLPDLETMLEFCEQRGIRLNAQPVMFERQYYDSAARPLALTTDEIRAIHRRLADWKGLGRALMFSAQSYQKALEWPDPNIVATQSHGDSTCMAGRDYIHIEPNGDVLPCAAHGADFSPKNILGDGLIQALRHVQHHNCGDCWIPYLNERKLAFGLRPQALLEIARRG